jgi:predicted metal-dependent peptidase
MTQKTDIASAAAVRLTLKHYFWTEIYYSMNVVEATPEEVAEGIETEATDGVTLWINRAHFAKLPIDQQVSEIVHELAHKILLHPTRRGARDPMLWNIACDHAVNTMMKTNGFYVGPDWVCDMKYNGWLAEAIYADLAKQQKENEKNGGGGQGPQMPKGRQDIKPPKAASPEEVAKHEDEVKALVDRAIANAKARGDLPAGIEQGVVQAYKPVKESWYNQLHRYMQSLSTSTYNWARINRRALLTHGVFAPLHYAEALGEVALFIDTSGSCFRAAQQANFAGHLNAILAEAKPRKVRMYYFDTSVYPGAEIEAGEIDIVTKPKGNGGTSFVPIFDELEREGIQPEVCIILTDLDGRFPKREPDYPVVWASIADKRVPFGDVIHIE